MKLYRHRKPAKKKREYLPAKANQRKRTASIVMALSVVMNAVKLASDLALISATPGYPSNTFAKGGYTNEPQSPPATERIFLTKQDKAYAIIEAVKGSAENMKSIIQRQSKLMK